MEVSRRLIAAADAAQPRSGAGAGATLRRRAIAVPVLVALPAIAAALYLTLGSPHLPGQPFASRAAPPPQRTRSNAWSRRSRSHLEKNPEDGRGWEVVGPVYMRFGRFEDAVKARRNSLRLNGPSADREADLGESLMAAANGIVTDDAKAAFDRALKPDAKHPKARFFLGVAAYQDGDMTSAGGDLARDAQRRPRPNSPWMGMVRDALGRVEDAPPVAQAPGPSAEDVAAAEKMKPDDRAAMVRGMVERLAERLKRDGSDVEGWLRLVRAYTVMGDRDRALSARRSAPRARPRCRQAPQA